MSPSRFYSGATPFCNSNQWSHFRSRTMWILLYADDTVLYCSGKDSLVIESTLNLNLNRIANWFNDNNLILNLKKGKTKCMLFGTKSYESLSLNILGKPINFTDCYKYLGVTLDRRLNLTQHMGKNLQKSIVSCKAFTQNS